MPLPHRSVRRRSTRPAASESRTRRGQGAVRRLTTVALLVCLGTSCFSTVAAPGPPPAEVLAGAQRFPDGPWAAVLSEAVDSEGRVDYAALVEDPAPLRQVVSLFAAVGPETRPELFPAEADRLAYYLNAYNALVMWQVVERWPIGSVGDAKADFFYFTRLPLDGGAISLYDLENDVVRGYGDPRIHFALNCASLGCPRLPREPFRAETLEEQLERETERFLLDPANVRAEGDTLHLSSIFGWYSEDFAPDPRTWVLGRRPALGLSEDGPVESIAYDWGLNERADAVD